MRVMNARRLIRLPRRRERAASAAHRGPPARSFDRRPCGKAPSWYPSLTFSLLARQLHQTTRFVDEEQVAGIVKVLSLEVFCPEFQLDFVIAHLTGVHHALAEVQCDLLRSEERRV